MTDADIGTWTNDTDDENNFFRMLVEHVMGSDGTSHTANGEELLSLLAERSADCCIRNWIHAQHAWQADSAYGADVGGGFGGGEGGNGRGFYGRDSTNNPEGRDKSGQDLGDLEAAITANEIEFCRPCLILIYGCRVSSTGDFASRLARITGCTVKAGWGGVSTAHDDGSDGSHDEPWRSEGGWDTYDPQGDKSNQERGPTYITPADEVIQ